MVITMKNDFYKIPSIFLILVFLGILIYSTYVKLTYKENVEDEPINDNIVDEKINKTNTLSCTYNHEDKDDIKANIIETIQIEYSNDEAVSQKYDITYNFLFEEDYNNFKEANEILNDKNTNYNDNSMVVKKAIENDYTTPYNSNDTMDYREKNYNEAKKELESLNYICK